MKAANRLATGIITLALLALAIGIAGTLIAWDRRQELVGFAQVVHRQLSQRVEQHDAHLTSLSALAQARPVPEDAIRQVATSIRQFYPRLVGIDVIAFEEGAARSLLSEALPPGVLATARDAGPTAHLSDAGQGQVFLTKRAGADSRHHHAIILTIDAARLMALDQPLPDHAMLALAHRGRPLARMGPEAEEANTVFREVLASRTQPLELSLETRLGHWTWPPARYLALMAALAFLGGFLADRLREASLRAREAARASTRARLDARLAHAGRINAMGEMASGIAHELTQPLTAILSQAQAGQRLMQRDNPDTAMVIGAFDAVARNARRAGDILGKLRSWISFGDTHAEQVPLAEVAADVAGLLRLNGLPDGVTLDLDIDPMMPVVTADRTQIEQVVFNLMRNALEAVAAHDGPRRVRLSVTQEGSHGLVRVEDSGPGLTQETKARLFEPFHTTKAQGMGLGLALCLTLVERFDGTLTAGTSSLGGAVFEARLPLARKEATP